MKRYLIGAVVGAILAGSLTAAHARSTVPSLTPTQRIGLLCSVIEPTRHMANYAKACPGQVRVTFGGAA